MDTIQSLWIGKITNVERLSMASFLAHGHPYHLYSYGPPDGATPKGVTIRDGNEIVPESDIKIFPNVTTFSNWFRYNMLFKNGGWWVDLDAVCCRPFDFPDRHIFVRHHLGAISNDYSEKMHGVCNGYIKAPAASQIMCYLIQTCRTMHWKTLGWGVTGPELITKIVRQFSMPCKPRNLFFLYSWEDWLKMLDPTPPEIPSNLYAIHLWDEEMRRANFDKNGTYSPTCLFESLKRKYGI